MKTVSAISLAVMIVTAPTAMAQTAEAPATVSAAQTPLTEKEIKDIRARIPKLEQEVRVEVRKALGGFGGAPDRNAPRVSTDYTNIDRMGRPVRDAVPVTATHQKLLGELRELDAQLKAAGVHPER